MEASRFLREKFDLKPTTESALADMKAEYLAKCRKEVAHDMFFYVIGSVSLALLGLAYAQPALKILAGIILGVVTLAYLSVNTRNLKRFEKAIEPVGLASLPNRLILLQANSTSLNSELKNLLKKQNRRVFRYQIKALYSVNHRDRVRDLQTAL
jgi:hypothetical protein